jgi:hypothetical protein
MYTKGRKLRIINTFINKPCEVCGVADEHLLVWFPHHKRITHYMLRYGRKTKEYQIAQQLIEKSFPVCLHCKANKDYNELIDEEQDPRWPH